VAGGTATLGVSVGCRSGAPSPTNGARARRGDSRGDGGDPHLNQREHGQRGGLRGRHPCRRFAHQSPARLSVAPTGSPFNPGRLVNLSILTSVTAGDPFFMGTVLGAARHGSKPLLIHWSRAAGARREHGDVRSEDGSVQRPDHRRGQRQLGGASALSALSNAFVSVEHSASGRRFPRCGGLQPRAGGRRLHGAGRRRGRLYWHRNRRAYDATALHGLRDHIRG